MDIIIDLLGGEGGCKVIDSMDLGWGKRTELEALEKVIPDILGTYFDPEVLREKLTRGTEDIYTALKIIHCIQQAICLHEGYIEISFR